MLMLKLLTNNYIMGNLVTVSFRVSPEAKIGIMQKAKSESITISELVRKHLFTDNALIVNKEKKQTTGESNRG